MNLRSKVQFVAVRFAIPRFCLACLIIALGTGGCRKPSPEAHPATSTGPAPATTAASTTQSALARFEYTQVHMGVPVRLVVYATDENAAVNASRAAFKRIAEIDDAASDYKTTSELNRLLAPATTRPVKLSDDLYTLFAESLRLSELSDGAFDISAGPFIRLWRQARRFGQLPPQAEIVKARQVVGWRKIALDPQAHTVRLAVSGMKIDFGGIAKGYAGDQAIAVLRRHGIRSALCEAGGDIVVSDPPPGKPGWSIRIADPGKDQPAEMFVSDCGISTSGDTEQFVEIAGKHYSHVVDPRTGWAVTSRAMGTILAPKGIYSDALSKTVYLVGPEKAPEILKHYPGAKAWVRTVTANGTKPADP